MTDRSYSDIESVEMTIFKEMFNGLDLSEETKMELSERANLHKVARNIRLALQPAAPAGCIICANGNDLPEGEQCQACGREGSAVGLRAAVIKARGRQEPPTTPVKMASGDQGCSAGIEEAATPSMRKALQEIAGKELHRTARADIWMQDKAREALTSDVAQPPAIPAGWILVPRTLTFENGAKSALIGEFHEDYGIQDARGDERWAKVAVTWTTIKEIHKKMVAHFDRTSAISSTERK